MLDILFEGLDAWVRFLGSLSFSEWMLYFWPFFFVDFMRWWVFDLLIFFSGLIGPNNEASQTARGALYREQPLVSVLIPGKDEGPNLEPLIRSLNRQTYSNLEIILIDDGSEDRTPEIGRRMEETGRVDRFLRQEVRGGKASAANTGLRFASGKYVVHVDADSYLDDAAIENVLLPFYGENGTNVGAVSGDVRVANRWASLATRLQTFEYLKTITLGRQTAAEVNVLGLVSGAFGAFPRRTLQRIGGWDVGPGEDGDVTMRIRKLGYDIAHVSGATCFTNVPEGFFALTKQRVRWSRSLIRYRFRKHVDVINPMSPFRVSDLITVGDNLLFNLAINAKWIVYVGQIIYLHTDIWPHLFVTNVFLYAGLNTLNFFLIWYSLRHILRPDTTSLLPLMPLMPFYIGMYIRAIRTYAYVMELFFRSSYLDAFNPWKVGRIAREKRT